MSDIIIPAGEALDNADKTQKEIKQLYRNLVETQQEDVNRLKYKFKQLNKEPLKDKELIKFKMRSIKEQLEELMESRHYLVQDYEQLIKLADLSGRASSAKQVLDDMDREIEMARQELSQLNALL